MICSKSYSSYATAKWSPKSRSFDSQSELAFLRQTKSLMTTQLMPIASSPSSSSPHSELFKSWSSNSSYFLSPPSLVAPQGLGDQLPCLLLGSGWMNGWMDRRSLWAKGGWTIGPKGRLSNPGRERIPLTHPPSILLASAAPEPRDSAEPAGDPGWGVSADS